MGPVDMLGFGLIPYLIVKNIMMSYAYDYFMNMED